MTVGDADTPWHPRFFSPVTFESKRLTNYGPKVEVVFELVGLAVQHFVSHHSTCTISFSLAYHRLGQGWASDVVAEDHRMFCECFFAGTWNGLDVAIMSSGLLQQSQGVPSHPGGVLLPHCLLDFLCHCCPHFDWHAHRGADGSNTVVQMGHVVFVGTFKLDISFRLSRLRVTSARSVVYGRANIEVVIHCLGDRTGAVLFKLMGTNPRTGNGLQGGLFLQPSLKSRDIKFFRTRNVSCWCRVSWEMCKGRSHLSTKASATFSHSRTNSSQVSILETRRAHKLMLFFVSNTSEARQGTNGIARNSSCSDGPQCHATALWRTMRYLGCPLMGVGTVFEICPVVWSSYLHMLGRQLRQLIKAMPSWAVGDAAAPAGASDTQTGTKTDRQTKTQHECPNPTPRNPTGTPIPATRKKTNTPKERTSTATP